MSFRYVRTSPIFCVVLLVAFVASARSEEPLFEKVDVFPAREHGYHHVRIPGIVVTQKGTILAYGEARHGEAANDWADIDIVLRRSEDGGKSWGSFQVLEDGKSFQSDHRNTAAKRAPGQENFVTCNNAVMFVDRTRGLIHVFYCIEYERCFYRSSGDDG